MFINTAARTLHWHYLTGQSAQVIKLAEVKN